MPWSVMLLTSLASGPTAGSVTPVDQVTGDITSYILSYGVVGVGLVILGTLFWKGWRLMSPAREAEIRKTVREEARADLEAELARVIAEKKQAEEQRDSALNIARTEFVPVLSSFKDATGALIPLLQEVIRYQESGGGHSGTRRLR